MPFRLPISGRRFILALLALLAAGTAAEAAAGPSLEDELAGIVRLGVPGAIAILLRGGEEESAAVGVAEIATGRTATVQDTFRIASITKLFTAAAVFRQMRTGQLALDDPVGWLLPRIVPLADRITVRQLLGHTSGVPDYLAGPSQPFNASAARLSQSLGRSRPRAELLRAAAQARRERAPGTAHAYSNTNYVLLEALLERAEGRPYASVVADRVLAPLDLRNTGFPDARGRFPGPALRGYVPSDGSAGAFTDRKRPIDVTEHTFFMGGDGGLYSNAPDLMRFARALIGGDLVTADELGRMLADAKEDHDGSYRYGLGIMIFPTVCARQVLGHEGRDIGTFSAVFADRDGSTVLVLAMNAAPDHVPKLGEAVADLRDRVFCN